MANLKEIAEKISNRIGIKFKTMTIYRAELIHLRNDGLQIKQIGKIFNVKETMVQNWFSKNAQPRDEIIENLEKLYFERQRERELILREPTLIKNHITLS